MMGTPYICDTLLRTWEGESQLRYRLCGGEYSGSSLGVSDSESEMSLATGSVVPLKKPMLVRRGDGGEAVAQDSSVESIRKAAKLDELLDGLRAVLPEEHTTTMERTHVIMEAYHYIANLQRQVDDLIAELLDDSSSNSAHTRPDRVHFDSQWSLSIHGEEPVVDVARSDGLLEVGIVCANRPGLLVEIMEAIESAGHTVMYTRIARHNEIVVEHLNLEMDKETQDAEGEEERVKAILLRAISQRPASSHLQTSMTQA